MELSIADLNRYGPVRVIDLPFVILIEDSCDDDYLAERGIEVTEDMQFTIRCKHLRHMALSEISRNSGRGHLSPPNRIEDWLRGMTTACSLPCYVDEVDEFLNEYGLMREDKADTRDWYWARAAQVIDRYGRLGGAD